MKSFRPSSRNRSQSLRATAASAVFSVFALTSAVHAQTITYGYDALGRVVTATFSNNLGTTYSYDPMGNRTQTRTVGTVSCVNASCASTNSFAFPVRNLAGAKNAQPFYCAGAWNMNTVNANFVSSCSTGWVPVNCDGVATCPDPTTQTIRTEFGCINTECRGFNTVVWPVQNGAGASNGAQKYLCAGEWTMNVAGTNFSSTCSTGWTPFP